MKARTSCVISVLGAGLDRGLKPHRWTRWRPTVDLCRHEDFVVDELLLLYRPAQSRLLRVIMEDIAQVSPETKIRPILLSALDETNLGEVYQDLLGFAGGHEFDLADVDYFVHTTPASQIVQLCLLKLTESRHLPAELLQSHAPSEAGDGDPGQWQVLHLDPAQLTQRPEPAASAQIEWAQLLRGGIETKNELHKQCIDALVRVGRATFDALFFVGPMGIGKSDLARRVYEMKKQERQLTGDFVEINCATIPREREYDLLFSAAGVFATHPHGLIYLDEPVGLSLASQAMLKRKLRQESGIENKHNEDVNFGAQVIVGARSDLKEAVRRGVFREDLWLSLASWQFNLQPLCQRHADISPNIDFALRQHMKRAGRRVEFNSEARISFEEFSRSAAATWNGNFRDLNAAVTRMATFALLGKITREGVREEIRRLKYLWSGPKSADLKLSALLKPELLVQLDRFEVAQLADVLSVCAESRSLSDAGRALFSESRKRKARPNDADRLRKYLAKYELEWASLPHV